MAVGKRIYLRRELPDSALVEGFAQLPAANVSDVMSRGSAMEPSVRLVTAPVEPVAAGPAFTVKCRAGDNLLLHAAVEYCREGDVLVVTNEGGRSRALIGEVILSALRFEKKVRAVVVDGPMRDIGEIAGWDFPVYCAGFTPGGPYKEGPGELNVPVCCGGVVVEPGDMIVLDADGVVAVPRREAADILEKARAYHRMDEEKARAARRGEAERGWLAPELARRGYEIIDGVCRP